MELTTDNIEHTRAVLLICLVARETHTLAAKAATMSLQHYTTLLFAIICCVWHLIVNDKKKREDYKRAFSPYSAICIPILAITTSITKLLYIPATTFQVDLESVLADLY